MSLITIIKNAVRDAVREMLTAELPELVASSVRSVLEQDLRPAVCSILEAELSDASVLSLPEPPTKEVVKAVSKPRRSRAANGASAKPAATSRPRLVSRFGVEVGQTWEAKPYKTGLLGRVIKIQELHRDVVPEVITAADGKTRTNAKPISYKSLNHAYKLMVD